jgi:hypothetical protein
LRRTRAPPQLQELERPPQALHRVGNRRDDRPFAHHGKVEARTQISAFRIGMMVVIDDVDAADEGQLIVDQDQLAVQAAQQPAFETPPAFRAKDDDLRPDRLEPLLQHRGK